jgi:hypothetical protein
MAQRLTKLAFEASLDKKRVTPYSKVSQARMLSCEVEGLHAQV